jgi:hypothetical protein
VRFGRFVIAERAGLVGLNCTFVSLDQTTGPVEQSVVVFFEAQTSEILSGSTVLAGGCIASVENFDAVAGADGLGLHDLLHHDSVHSAAQNDNELHLLVTIASVSPVFRVMSLIVIYFASSVELLAWIALNDLVEGGGGGGWYHASDLLPADSSEN